MRRRPIRRPPIRRPNQNRIQSHGITLDSIVIPIARDLARACSHGLVRPARIPNRKETCYQVGVTTTLESLVAQMTVAELAERSGRSISDLIELVLSAGGTAPAGRSATNGHQRGKPGRKAAAAPAPTPSGRKKGAQTRTQAGRATYDESVLAAVKTSKGKVKAEDLRKKIGGTPPQLRAALARLIENGSVKSAGKARGTTYAAA
jgi:hypothetical protein